MKKLKLFACSICDEVIATYGNPTIICCNAEIKSLAISQANENELPKVTEFDGEYILTFNSSMTKTNHLMAVVVEYYDRIEVIRLYAEQEPEVHVSRIKGVKLYAVSKTELGIRAIYW